MAFAKDKAILYEGRHLRLVKIDEHWECAERVGVRGVVGIVAMNDAGQFILVEQFRPALGCNVIELPAGLVGDDAGMECEEFEAAARRELLEETGYEAVGMDLLMDVTSSSGLTNEVVRLFVARGLKKTGVGGGVDGERIKVHEIELDRIDEWLAERTASGAICDPRVWIGIHFLLLLRALNR